MQKTPYKHWKNSDTKGDTLFITTSCLDHAHLFQRENMKNKLMHRLASDCAYYQCILHAFVIMSNHVHFIIKSPEGKTASRFLQRFKSNSAKSLLPLLSDEEKKELRHQSGLDGRLFWARSFRSVPIVSDDLFMQKATYIHQNPVRAGLVARDVEYRWSSAKYYEMGLWPEEKGIAEAVLGDATLM